MAITYNKVIMVGRVSKVPEAKMGKDGRLFTTFDLAVNRLYNIETDFFRCISFGKTAEIVSKYVEKGNLILIEGSVQINKWQDRNGVNRENAEVLVNRVVFLETKKSREEREEDVGEVEEENFEDIDELSDEFEKFLEEFKDD